MNDKEIQLPLEKPENIQNLELKSAFDQIPGRPQEGKPPLSQEERDALKLKMVGLIANSTLGPAVRKLYERPIEIALEKGIDKPNATQDSLFKLLALDSPNGGMYNPWNSIDIARSLIKNRTEMDSSVKKDGRQGEFDYDLSEAIEELTK